MKRTERQQVSHLSTRLTNVRADPPRTQLIRLRNILRTEKRAVHQN
jgi:hypothetical protein